MGPITYANCEAFCTRRGYKCEGCHTAVEHEAVIKFGIQAFLNASFRPEEILEAARVFSFDGVKRIENVMHKLGIMPTEGQQ